MLFKLPRWQKRTLMLGTDMLLLPLAVWISFALRLGEWQPHMQDGFWMMLLAPLVTIPIFVTLSLYRAIIRFIGGQALFAVMRGVTYSTAMLLIAALALEWQGIPRSVFPIYWGVAFLLIGGSRYLVRRYYYASHRNSTRINLVIYGAGESGTQLAVALENLPEYAIIAYLDDNPTLQKSIIRGIKVHSPQDLPSLIEKRNVQQVLLAMPSESIERRQEIIQFLEPYKVHVRTIPGMLDLVTGRNDITEFREIEIDELLGRASVSPDQNLMSLCIHDKQVIVTGAGGSIGSEMCRQILRLKPRTLVLFEASEFALYQIEQELLQVIKHEQLATVLVPVLGSVQDRQRVEEVLRKYQIHTLYHAAAYKHVPMVEHNPIEGIRNNTFGTLQTALAAKATGVERFVLISTDKAVRPTNVMGATKRMAELVLQGLAHTPGKTVFSMVRFGNVLGSSGSVVPLFRKQIATGGPVTVTHPDIIRYFMTIPEAAQLVIQAGAMAEGGEVFLLDMGEPVKIVNLAERMIKLSGLTVKDEQNPDGDISIKFTGLRPGEKLYEELLIAGDTEPTKHPRIHKAHEHSLPWEEMEQFLRELESACKKRNSILINHLLAELVDGYQKRVLAA